MGFLFGRQAELLERKRLKKLRQKEQKMIGTSNGEKIDFKSPSLDSPPDCIGSTETSSPSDSSVTSEASHNHENQLVDFVEPSAAENDGNADKRRRHESHKEDQNISDCGKSYADDHEQDVVHRAQGTGHIQPNHFRHVHSRLTQNNPDGFQAGQVSAARSSVNMRHNKSRDSKAISRPNGHKVWTKKSRPDNNEDGKDGEEMTDRDVACQPFVSERSEVLIGSINVSLGTGDIPHPNTILESKRQENLVKPDSSSVSKPVLKLWKPVSLRGNGNSIQNDHGDAKPLIPANKDAERLLPERNCLAFEGFASHFEGRGGGTMMFSIEAAKAFLAQSKSYILSPFLAKNAIYLSSLY